MVKTNKNTPNLNVRGRDDGGVVAQEVVVAVVLGEGHGIAVLRDLAALLVGAVGEVPKLGHVFLHLRSLTN